MSRPLLVLAALTSIALHAALFYGSMLVPKKAAIVARVEEAPVIRLVIPELKELEEPEPTVGDEAAEPIDLAIPVPMQADLPALPNPHDFVQPLNFASLFEKPDFSRMDVNVIPEHYVRGSQLAERIGKIFQLAELDRHPEPVLQPAPIYPHAQRREGVAATVHVEFVVDTNGRVLEPVVVETTEAAFNDAATFGVSRWKFRPGLKGGRKVNVRMRVPIHFKLLGDID